MPARRPPDGAAAGLERTREAVVLDLAGGRLLRGVVQTEAVVLRDEPARVGELAEVPDRQANEERTVQSGNAVVEPPSLPREACSRGSVGRRLAPWHQR
jgi:hypothetical protein